MILPVDNDRILFLINLLSFIEIYTCIPISKQKKKILSTYSTFAVTDTYEPFNAKVIQVKKVDQ